MNFAAKSQAGKYWCGDPRGWIACRFCAVKMSREAAHARAHSVGGRVVRIVKPQSHALASREKDRQAMTCEHRTKEGWTATAIVSLPPACIFCHANDLTARLQTAREALEEAGRSLETAATWPVRHGELPHEAFNELRAWATNRAIVVHEALRRIGEKEGEKR